MQGKVKKLIPERGFGFITAEDGRRSRAGSPVLRRKSKDRVATRPRLTRRLGFYQAPHTPVSLP
jgi:hypothetical protein